MKGGLNGSPLFDKTGTSKQLSDLLAKLNKSGDAVANAPAGKAGGVGPANYAVEKVDADRLARIGGTIGGHGSSPALNYHMRTAAATERMAKGIDALVTGHLQTGKLQTGTLWQ